MKIRLANTTTQGLKNIVMSKRGIETNKNYKLFSFFMTLIYFQVYNYLSFYLF